MSTTPPIAVREQFKVLPRSHCFPLHSGPRASRQASLAGPCMNLMLLLHNAVQGVWLHCKTNLSSTGVLRTDVLQELFHAATTLKGPESCEKGQRCTRNAQTLQVPCMPLFLAALCRLLLYFVEEGEGEPQIAACMSHLHNVAAGLWCV